MFRTSAMDYFPPHLISCHLNFARMRNHCWYLIARKIHWLQNNSLVLSVKFVEANKGYGNWIPRPIVPHCPSNCMVRGCVAPNRGCSAVTLKSGCGEKLIWSLIGRPFRQSEPDHDVGNNILMVSNRVLVAVYSFSEVEVNNSCNIEKNQLLNLLGFEIV